MDNKCPALKESKQKAKISQTCQRFIETCCVVKKYTHIKLRYNWNNFCHKPAKCTPCPNPFVPTKKAETASLLESAVSGEAFFTQADCSVITLGGSTSTERGERGDDETGVRRDTTREREKEITGTIPCHGTV